MESIVRVMATSGNNVHAPDYHAEVTAEKIISAAQTAVVSISNSSPVASVGREVRKKIEAILLAHHGMVHEHEQSGLTENGLAHCDGDLDSRHLIDDDRMLDAIAQSGE